MEDFPETSEVFIQTDSPLQSQAVINEPDIITLHSDENHPEDVVSMKKRPQNSNEQSHVLFQNDKISDLRIPTTIKARNMAGENTETNAAPSDRQLDVLKQSEPVRRIAVSVQENITWTNPTSVRHDFCSGKNSCMCVSATVSDRKGNIMEVAHDITGDIKEEVLKNNPFDCQEHERKNDVELKELKSELQRQDLEILKLKADLQKLKSQENELDRSTVSDKFIDKVNAVRTPSVIARHEKCDALPYSRLDTIYGVNLNRFSFNDNLNGVWDIQDCPRSNHGTYKHNFLSEQVNCIKDKIVAQKRGTLSGQLMTSDMERHTFEVYLQLRSLISNLELCMETLRRSIAMLESSDNDSSNIDNGTISDELFIVRKNIYKLMMLYQELAYHFFDCKAGHNWLIDFEKQVAQTECGAFTFESLCIQKDRRIEQLEGKIDSLLKEVEAGKREKYELSSIIQNLSKETDDQKYQIKDLFDINEELLQFSQKKEEKLESLQVMNDHLREQVVQYQEKLMMVESLLKQKDQDMEELKKRLKVVRIATDAIIFEKLELLSKLQEMQKEAEEHQRHISELISINEELVELVGYKEGDQVEYTPGLTYDQS